MFSNLMPKRKEFFELLAAHSDRVVAGAKAALRLMNGLGDRAEDITALIEEVNANEKSGDKIKAEIITLLHRSFTTPINRDQIHSLVIELDSVLNALEHVANAVRMYNIQESTAEARELAALAADSCMRLNRAVTALSERSRDQETKDLCKEIDSFETRADAVQRQAISRLFDGSCSIWTAIKMREFYSLQEEVLDRCEVAAKTIQEILIENS